MKRIVSIALIGIGLLLFFAVAAWIYFNNLITHPTAIPLPDQLGGLRIADYKTGAQAATDFINLHGKQVPIASGAIGVYGDNQITVWVAGAPFHFMAARMVEAMRERITEGNSPFMPIEQLNDGKRTIYALEGMGQKHFYWQSKNLVIWLAAEPSLANEALEQILEAYP